MSGPEGTNPGQTPPTSSGGWMDKAKEMAAKAAEEAKKLAETAKNANYGEMLDKTKNMAMLAADEAKKAAGAVMAKEKDPNAPTAQDNMSGSNLDPYVECTQRLAKVEALLQEVKDLLSKSNSAN